MSSKSSSSSSSSRPSLKPSSTSSSPRSSPPKSSSSSSSSSSSKSSSSAATGTPLGKPAAVGAAPSLQARRCSGDADVAGTGGAMLARLMERKRGFGEWGGAGKSIRDPPKLGSKKRSADGSGAYRRRGGNNGWTPVAKVCGRAG